MSESIKPIVNQEEESRDLGFGAVVARESRERLLNADGSFNVARRGLGFWSSFYPYHTMLTMSWPSFLGVVAIFYTATNVAFALAYMACGADALTSPPDLGLGNRFLRAFFFSVDTLATVGYGNISPSGEAAHTVVAIEALAGILGVALITGLVFARFSRPTAQIIFSRAAVIAPYRGTTALMFRIANARSNEIVELSCKVLFARFVDADGQSIRRFYPLALERERVVFFPLSWTVVHPIDKSSPLYGLTDEDLKRGSAEFLILLSGLDESFSQTVHTRSSYAAGDVIWGARFANVFNRRAGRERLTIDVRRLHDIERVEMSEPARNG
ncbi:MAG TPA: ion channel [Blastocatellia bacterium]|nr:ion channel [Blastocatellia bacterium]